MPVRLPRNSEGSTWKGLLAVTRGGLAPAACLSRYLDITHVETICIASYDNRSQRDIDIIKKAELADDGNGWLIVDDLADTGKTLHLVKEMLPRAHIATLYVKMAGRHLPHTWFKEFEQSTWIVFPWEV